VPACACATGAGERGRAGTGEPVEGSGWEKQLNLISWNDRDAKYDIREWSPDGEKMGKGVTLSKEELVGLKELLNNFEF
jgi:hypothetical protein